MEIITVIAMLVILFTIVHNFLLVFEKNKMHPNGKIICIDNNKFHLFVTGNSNGNKPTIILMSGSSLPSPVYNYKKLYSHFSNDYRVVVIEKLGYGYSDISHSPRDIQTILSQTRETLKLANEKPPYILIPHSMSGIEAQLWALNYPDEVASIIGLDMALPKHYEDMNLGFRIKLYKILASTLRNLGIQRLTFIQKYAGVYDMKFLSPEEWKQEKYIIAKMSLNKMILNESTEILNSALIVKKLGVIKIPMLLFVSNGKFEKNWIHTYRKYMENTPNAKMIEVDCGHMMHNYCADSIAITAKEFLESIRL